MIDPRTAPDAITVPYRIDREAILVGLNLADAAGGDRRRIRLGPLALSLLLAWMCAAWGVFVMSLTAQYLQLGSMTQHLAFSDSFAAVALTAYFVPAWLFFWALLSSGLRSNRRQQVGAILDVFGASPDGRLTLSRHGIVVETSLNLRLWRTPMLRLARETREAFVFISKLHDVIALPKQGLSPDEILAVRDRVRSGMLGRTD